MSSARDEIFANIRRSLGVSGNERIRTQMVDDRIERAPRGVIPARGQLDSTAREDLFKEMARLFAASVTSVTSAKDVPGAVASFLRDNNLPAAIRIGADNFLVSMPWEDTAIEVANGPSKGQDLTAVSHAISGVAETGTLILTSGSDNPTTLNFLPDNHIVVLRGADIIGDYETVWQKLRKTFGKGEMPRTVNMITGPSRSADIEQKLLLGAHGPRTLHIIVVDT